ncbi:hypothetical protein ACIQUZ_27995 [Streptomyces griseus]|uniref:Uncharacterized protein n=2 Tax=Streptomyces TaxID=1883 RepID=B1W2P2_STRGG|nr:MULTISPECIES: hypothetical protein [Streptomyces]MYT76722.1 hypothetical protein [Streptomyces sp. SID8364]EGE42173.1 hypothetical protein SACT1_2831 [Streptomyces sp. ACT-1]MBW3705043.1 hypothetical protein [Streptomyces griseus]SQA26586.1 Uncharacterised protein [Streptomyces griseus]BAG19406.1 hypothetical protein SGR_2577 [Streptomyces griseus subsp. griseus NBRC 13350]
MSAGRRDPREEQVRRMLDGPHPALPPDLAAWAVLRGGRRLRRRRAVRRTAGLLLALALSALLVWAGVEQPWESEPAQVTPPLQGW